MNKIASFTINTKPLLYKIIARLSFIAEVVDIVHSKLTCSMSKLTTQTIGAVTSFYKITTK